MKNYMFIVLFRAVIVLLGAMLLPRDMVAAAQVGQQQLAFNARAPRVEALVLDAPVLPGVPAVVEELIVPTAGAVPAVAPVAAPVVTPMVAAPVSSSVPAAVQQVVSANVPTVEAASVAVPSVPTAMPIPTVQQAAPDLNARIKQLYSTMQGAQNVTYNAATYANFGAALVNVFNEAVETQSYMIQLLNAASGTPLLNGEQQNYVRQAMIPNLDQIDETTKPLAPASAPVAKNPSRTQLYAAAHVAGAGNVVTTPGGKKKRKKGKKKTLGAAAAAAPVHAAHKAGKKNAVNATAGVAMAKPAVGATNPSASVVAHKKAKHVKKVPHTNATTPVAVTVPDPAVPVVVVPGGTADDGDIIL